ncbi:MAG: TolC family protein [Proteobacteria bacterium]|nr:TolC family protein [Pseudomonadota bacterium]
MKLIKKPILHICVIILLITLAVTPVALCYEEIGLDEALVQFYKSNFDIVASKYEIDKAYADYVTAKLLPNPNLTVNYNNLAMSQWKTSRWDNTQLTVRVDQLIETGGKRALRTGVASEVLEATRISHKDVIRNLLIGFYNLYYTLNLDDLSIEFARNELARYNRLLQVAEKRFSAGFLSSIDYTKLKVGKIDLENNHTNLANQLLNDIDSFSLLLGSDVRRKPARVYIQDRYPTFVEADLFAVANENRHDLLSLQRQRKAAENNISLAKAYRIPDFSIGGEYDSTGNPATSGIGMGISVPLPIFNRYQGEIAKRTAEMQQLDVQLAKTKRRIASDVHLALNNYTAALKVFESYRDNKDQMDTLMQNSEKAFSLGGITVLELLDTQKTYRDFITKYHQTFIQSVLNGHLIKVYTGEIK